MAKKIKKRTKIEFGPKLQLETSIKLTERAISRETSVNMKSLLNAQLERFKMQLSALKKNK